MWLRYLLTEMEEPITDRNFPKVVRQGLTEEYRNVNRMTWTGPDFNLPKIQSVLLHLCLDERSRTKTVRIAGRGTTITAASISPDPSAIICHNFGKEGHCGSGCAAPVKQQARLPKEEIWIREQCWAEVVLCAQDDHAQRRRVLHAKGSVPTYE